MWVDDGYRSTLIILIHGINSWIWTADRNDCEGFLQYLAILKSYSTHELKTCLKFFFSKSENWGCKNHFQRKINKLASREDVLHRDERGAFRKKVFDQKKTPAARWLNWWSTAPASQRSGFESLFRPESRRIKKSVFACGIRQLGSVSVNRHCLKPW